MLLVPLWCDLGCSFRVVVLKPSSLELEVEAAAREPLGGPAVLVFPTHSIIFKFADVMIVVMTP